MPYTGRFIRVWQVNSTENQDLTFNTLMKNKFMKTHDTESVSKQVITCIMQNKYNRKVTASSLTMHVLAFNLLTKTRSYKSEQGQNMDNIT